MINNNTLQVQLNWQILYYLGNGHILFCMMYLGHLRQMSYMSYILITIKKASKYIKYMSISPNTNDV